jgi:hypothetical protein
MLVRSMQRVAEQPLGFTPENVVASTITLPRSISLSRSGPQSAVQRIVDRLQTHPAVIAAAGGPRPLGSGPGNVVRLKDRPDSGIPMQVADVTTNYFLVVGATVTAGRGLVESDRTTSPAPVVLNTQAVKALALSGEPAGQELLIDRFPVKVVGILADIRQSLEAPRRPSFMFTPHNPAPPPVANS